MATGLCGRKVIGPSLDKKCEFNAPRVPGTLFEKIGIWTDIRLRGGIDRAGGLGTCNVIENHFTPKFSVPRFESPARWPDVLLRGRKDRQTVRSIYRIPIYNAIMNAPKC